MTTLSGSVVRDALAAVGAVGKQLRTFDELAAGATSALRQAPPGLTADGAAAFLATCAVESAWFRTTVEYGSGQRYAPFIGRTFIQLTWEDNYRAFGRWCAARGLVADPDLFARTPTALGAYEYAWLGPVHYFDTARLWDWANAGDFRRVSQAVNGGRSRAGTTFTPNGWGDRQAMYAVFRRAGPALLPTTAPARPAPDQEDDDMTPAQAAQLAEIHTQLLSGWPGWGGGSVDPDGRPFVHTLVDWARRTDVHIAALHDNLNRGVHAKLDELLAAARAQPVEGVLDEVVAAPVFTADDVRHILAEALASTATITITAKETPA